MFDSTLPQGPSSTVGLSSYQPKRASVASAEAVGCTASSGPSAVPLGTIARFPATASQCGTEFVPLGASSHSVECDERLSRYIQRFALQSVARELVPRERVAMCLRRPIPTRSLIDVLYSPGASAGHFGGLQVCGSVWMCPVCGAKITERRRVELSAGIAGWPGRTILATFTLQHNSTEALSVVLRSLLGAYEGLRSCREWRSFREYHGLVASIRGMEVTHGSSGWHPHLHVLMFLQGEVKIIPFEQGLKEQWQYQLSRSGRYASWTYGVDVRFSDAAVADYVAKFGKESDWTVAHEMAKAPVKAGRAGGRSPLQLLADALAGDEMAGRLWLQYAVNFKGKKQLVWSRGLRAILGLVEDEKTDEEIAVEQDQVAIILAQLTHSQWRVVLGNDARGELLEVASIGDSECVWAFLEGLGVRRVDVYS